MWINILFITVISLQGLYCISCGVLINQQLEIGKEANKKLGELSNLVSMNHETLETLLTDLETERKLTEVLALEVNRLEKKGKLY